MIVLRCKVGQGAFGKVGNTGWLHLPGQSQGAFSGRPGRWNGLVLVEFTDKVISPRVF